MATSKTLYTGKRELTMAEYEALETIDINKDYNITDYPTNGITNAQMTFALTCNRLFPENSTFTCIDDGTYGLGKTYKIKVTDGIKSWEEVPTGSGGEKKYLHQIYITDSYYGKMFINIITEDSQSYVNNVDRFITKLYEQYGNYGYFNLTGSGAYNHNINCYGRTAASASSKQIYITIQRQNTATKISIDGVDKYVLDDNGFRENSILLTLSNSNIVTDTVVEL